MIPNTEFHQASRESFRSFLQSGETYHAIRAARVLLREASGTREWMFIRKELERVPKGKLALKRLKVALLSSFSSEFLHAPLVAYGFVNGLHVDIYQAGFGQFRQEILKPRSGLYAFSPDVVILAVEGKDWVPGIYRRYLDGLETGFETAISEFRVELETLIQTLRECSTATVLMHNFTPPIWPQLGILDPRMPLGQSAVIFTLNELMGTVSRETLGTYVVDYANLVGRFGALRWYDERMDHLARAPIAAEMLQHLVLEYMKFLRGLTGQTKKCLVLDLDDTLWGGVLGEVGVAGIQLGPAYPGSAFIAFQEEILNLHKRGVLLAIASKNNRSDVEEVFASHPHMVLKKEHFASAEINWEAKSQSLVNISRQLNIGLEHMVFVDDNPVECEEIASALPMVLSLCLPKQPEQFVRSLLEEGVFDGLSFSTEDLRRGELYRQRDQAQMLRKQSGSLEDFYRGLDMKVVFSPVQKSTLARVAQLTQKTNQFTVTALRYTESELSLRASDPNCIVTTVSVRDRFGDNGIVGVMIALVSSGALEVDTFLLSCRVIGRTVETAMLAYLCEEASRRGVKEIRGRIEPTSKNLPVRDLFEKHGFQRVSEEESEETLWRLILAQGHISYPEWIDALAETPSLDTHKI